MPHYKDGTPTEIGDFVKGVPYNTGGREVVGTLVQITEDTDSCNCIVLFAEAKPTSLPVHEFYSQNIPVPKSLTRRKGGRVKMQDSGEQETLLLHASYDYGAVKDFVKV